MRNLTFTACVIMGGTLLGLYGWNWWYFAIFIIGLLCYEYVPSKDRQLVIDNLKLRNEKLELEIKKLKEKVEGVK